MTTLLKRLSMSLDLERRSSFAAADHSLREPGAARGVAASTSFNDFSMHVGQEVDHHAPEPPHSPTAGVDIPLPRRSYDPRTGFSAASAPAGPVLSPIATKALKIPRPSVAALLQRETAAAASGAGTPRSSLDAMPLGSVPTPRAAPDDACPASPRSPATPGGRRRRAQKIHGMDFYEFAELVRAGSSM